MSIKQVREIRNAEGQTERKLVKVSGTISSNIDLRIGVPFFWRSTNLPPNHAWPDGSLVLFADWPEFAKVYEQGGFTGMLLPWDADAATQAANLGKFRPNAANPSGLYLPMLGGQFFRNWALGDGQEAGAWGRDEIRNIYGRFAFQTAAHGAAYLAPVADAGQIIGAFKIFGPPHSAAYPSQAITSAGPGIGIEMNAFNNVPTGQQNVPQHIWQPVIIYLGRPR